MIIQCYTCVYLILSAAANYLCFAFNVKMFLTADWIGQEREVDTVLSKKIMAFHLVLNYKYLTN